MSNDTRQEAVKAMAKALEDMGYRRDSDPAMVDGPDAMYAAGAMIKRLVDLKDAGFLFEFLTEPGGWETDANLFGLLADLMMCPPSPGCSSELAHTFATRARWYGEEFLGEALGMLETEAEMHADNYDEERMRELRATA